MSSFLTFVLKRHFVFCFGLLFHILFDCHNAGVFICAFIHSFIQQQLLKEGLPVWRVGNAPILLVPLLSVTLASDTYP